jgi:Mannosyltransferase (PIG-V)
MGSSADYNENEIPASTQTQGAHLNGVSATQSIADSDHVEVDISPTQTRQAPRPFPWLKWYNAFKQVLPIYLAIHLAFLILTYLASLFSFPNFSQKALPLTSLWHSWYRWDSGHFTHIATYGYDAAWRTAFFPLLPLLERVLAFLTNDPFVAGLIIANLAGLVMLVVLFRLVEEDYDFEKAYRTVLYLSVFPTAFFFAAAYNESLFLCLAVLSFYHMRHGHWWLAGMFGFLASLTRSVGLLLLVPFYYEYLRQHDFKLRTIRFDIISSISIPGGLVIFTLYCYFQFHDLLAFSHSQAVWHHELHGPWHGFIDSFMAIIRHSILSFDSIHNVIDLSADLLILILIFLCFVGPWKFSRDRWSYGLYAAITYLFSLLFPLAGGFPLASVPRYMLEIFPVFIVLAAIGKKQQFNLYYLTLSGALLFFMLLQFLTGGWIV